MRLGIDASNIRSGGGVVHLVELLNNLDPHSYGINNVIVWGGETLLSQLPKKIGCSCSSYRY